MAKDVYRNQDDELGGIIPSTGRGFLSWTSDRHSPLIRRGLPGGQVTFLHRTECVDHGGLGASGLDGIGDGLF